jgi:hypothetical protein
MFTTTLLAGALFQLTFVPEPARPAHPHASADETVCRRLTLPKWNKPRLVCLTRLQWRELARTTSLEQQQALIGKR